VGAPVIFMTRSPRLRGEQESEVEDDERWGEAFQSAWRPKIHYVWDELLDELLLQMVADAIQPAPFKSSSHCG